MTKIYAGIGSRETPMQQLATMRFLALNFIQKGYTLRSGGAPGADQEFEWGAAKSGLPHSTIEELVEIYLPWSSFEKDGRSNITPIRDTPQMEAFAIAAEFHPRWQYLSRGARLLHARNVHQIYGYDVTKPEFADFVVCWTPGAKLKGGTAQALRIAQNLNIKTYNLGDDNQYDELIDKEVI